MAGNRPAREKFDFSLDARQVAGVILGSLGALGLAFFLGHSLGQNVAERPAASSRPPVKAPPPADPLAALDHAPRPDGGEPSAPLSFHESLTSPRPPPDRLPPSPKVQAPPAPVPAPVKAQAPVAAAAAAAAPAADVAPTGPAVPVDAGAGKVAAATAPAPATASVAAPAAAPAVAPSAAPKASPPPRPAAPVKGGWVIQVGSTQERFEAERIAARFASRGARVSVADVPGKGRWYRVRLGSFDTREAADRYLRDLEKATGAKGFVASAN
jgi:cell division septation protein DedD